MQSNDFDNVFGNDKIFKVIENACNKVTMGHIMKAKALMREEIEVRNYILRSDTRESMIAKSLFLIYDLDRFDLIDFIIFQVLAKVELKFTGTYEFLNSFITIENSNVSDYMVYESEDIFSLSNAVKNVIPISSRISVVKDIGLMSVSKAARRVLKHLMKQFNRNGINPLPHFEFFEGKKHLKKFKNYKIASKNFISNDNTGDLQENDLNIDQEEYDVKPFKLSKENMSCYYDIDGIHGFASEKEIFAFKNLLNLKYSKKSMKRPITKNKYVNDKGVTRSLKDLLCVHFAELCLPTIGDERLDFFFVLNLPLSCLSENEQNNIKNIIYKVILTEIRETIASKRLKHCNSSFKKKGTSSHILIQSDEFSDVIDTDCTLKGSIDGDFIYSVVKKLSKVFSNTKTTIFFESYNTKHIFCDFNLEKVVERLKTIVDLGKICIELDLCCNIGATNLHESTVCCPENFFENDYSLNHFYLFNCSDFTTYHGHTVLRSLAKSSAKDSIKLLTNGISKINIYSPLLTQFLPRHFRSPAFPCYTSDLACTNFYNWSVCKKSKNRLQKQIEKLIAAKKGISESMNLDVDMRAEFRISSINIPIFIDFIKKVFENRILRYCSTQQLICKIQQGIDGLIKRLNDRGNCTMELIAKLGVYEVNYFERFICGGQNMHILPNTLKEEFLKGKSKTKINGVQDFDSLKLKFCESHTILTKLFKHNSKIKENVKSIIYQMIECIKVDFEKTSIPERSYTKFSYFPETLSIKSTVLNLLFETFIKAICSTYGFAETSLYVDSEETRSKSFSVTPITFEEVIHSYFSSPAVKFETNIYYGLFKYLTYVYDFDTVHSLLLILFKERKIKYFVKHIKNSGPKLRELSFSSKNTDEEIMIKKDLIRNGTRLGYNRNPNNSKQKSPRTSISEYILLYHALHFGGHDRTGKSSILNDLNYPFYIYATRHKFDHTSANNFLVVERKLNKSLHSLMNNFKIEDMTLEQCLMFLNVNDRYVNNSDVLRSIDELYCFARNKKFVDKGERYYNNLLKSQYCIIDGKDDYEFLFNKQESDSEDDDITILESFVSFGDADSSKYTENSNKCSPTVNISKKKPILRSTLKNVKENNVSHFKKRRPSYKIESDSSDDDFIILESSINSQGASEQDHIVCETSSSNTVACTRKKRCLVILPSKNECKKSEGVLLEHFSAFDFSLLNAISILKFSLLKLPELSLSTLKGVHMNPLFCLIPVDHLIINYKGKILLDILNNAATKNSRKVFINACRKEFFNSGIKFVDAIEFIRILDERNVLIILTNVKRAMRIQLTYLDYK